jgi:hypothetical protein
MKLINFQFTKISAERLENIVKTYKIQSNIDLLKINSIKENKIQLNEDILEITFVYKLDYSELANLELKGKILAKLDEKESKDVLTQWKNKKLPEQFKLVVFNLILTKSNIKALELEEELKIPYHISLPKVGINKK